MASATQPREEEAPAILHAPYARRQCTECHSAEASFQAPIAGGETCRKCHQAFYDLRPDDWSHGPVATGQCGLCHEPHKSPYPGLLKQATPNLCFTCHDSDATLARPYHVEAGSQPCTACHDPHSAGNRLLLADSTTYQRRQSFAKALPSPHAKWDKKDCTQCHASAQSNQVLPDVDSKCLTCHAQVQAGGGPGLHDPVRQGRCTACHTPHQSTRPHLIRPTAEQICLSCHHIQQIQTPAHPPMQRADCLLCHAGHSSPRPHLLRPFAETLIEPAGDAGATTRGSAGPPP